jgi:hypothetical protein
LVRHSADAGRQIDPAIKGTQNQAREEDEFGRELQLSRFRSAAENLYQSFFNEFKIINFYFKT